MRRALTWLKKLIFGKKEQGPSLTLREQGSIYANAMLDDPRLKRTVPQGYLAEYLWKESMDGDLWNSDFERGIHDVLVERGLEKYGPWG